MPFLLVPRSSVIKYLLLEAFYEQEQVDIFWLCCASSVYNTQSVLCKILIDATLYTCFHGQIKFGESQGQRS